MKPRSYFPIVVATLISALLVGSAMWPGISVLSGDEQPAKRDASGKDVEPGNRTSHVSVKDFSHLVADGDWSPAIQAAIDHVSAKNGYENGTTILFPPGTYKINKTIRLGKDRAHYGTRLSGYGAVLKGTKILDAQSVNYEERKQALAEAKDQFSLDALPGELDFDEKTNVGVPILELWDPPEIEGANFVIEGLTFDREAALVGVGIKVPAETVPKNITFRDVKINSQNVGVHINHCYQIRFESCLIRGNQIGIWGRNHFNSVSIINCEIRRQHRHGVVIGPNVNQWGNTGIHIAGNIFEEIKGYGILNLAGNGVTIIGNYFEMVGNSIGVLTPYWSTTIDTNAFMSFYGYGWNMNKHGGKVVSDQAHIILDSPDVQLRNNKYYGNGVMLFRLAGKTVLDTPPMIAEGVKFPHGAKAADSGGLGAYVYYADTGNFVFREFHLPSEDEALTQRIRQAKRKLEIATEDKEPQSRVAAQIVAQMEVGDILVSAGDFDRARVEYKQAFQYPAANQAEWRSTIQIAIADSYMKQKKYREAAAAYEEAQKIGVYGWRVEHAKTNLKQAKDLAAQER
ncbi:MAG: hypothetical protein DWI21_14325 [Planctomycetota bacterium]|nr:MAG: hypothetical protein DWI21_14325 [Planctomycetota bacterium]